MNPDHLVTWFFVLFATVYFLESIGGFYMTSAVTFIEKQFQIPSRLAGTMVSAGDFAYIPVVVFTSYFGGKGNRARWIGGGCILISIANLLISSSNFLFPVEEFHLDAGTVPSSLAYEVKNMSVPPFTHNSDEDDRFLQILAEIDPENRIRNNYIGPLKNGSTTAFIKYQSFCFYNKKETVCKTLSEVLATEVNASEEDVAKVRILTSLPFAFCHSTINILRQKNKETECAKEKNSNGPFIMIFCGLLILGVGRTMPFSLGLPLMDDNVKKKNLPVYFAGMFFVKILGPIIGLLVGSVLNKIYVNFDPPQGLSPMDPMWIGCWWLGFLIFGLLLFFPSLALFLFPSQTLAEDDARDAEEMEMHALKGGEGAPKKRRRLNLVDKHVRKNSAGEAFMPETFQAKFHDFLTTMRSVWKSPIYMGALFGRILDVLAFKGFFVFLGKYMEIQFGIPQHVIQKYMAFSGVIGFALGVATGSFAMKKYKLQGRKAATWVAICSFVAACLSFLNTSVGCESVLGTIGKQAISNNFSFPMCRADCSCDDMPLYPVCNTKGDVFYSPCQAGCPLSGANFTLFAKERTTSLMFTDCACSNTTDMTVSRDFCVVDECEWKFKLYFINQAIGAFFGGMSVVPGMLIILRCVKPEHRSVSLGFSGFIVSLCATLPSPVFWGKIFDLSCLMWRTTCNSTGACPIYDNDQLRIRIHLIYGGIRLFSLVSDVWVIYWAKGLKLTDEEEEEENGKELVEKEEEIETEDHRKAREARELIQGLEED